MHYFPPLTYRCALHRLTLPPVPQPPPSLDDQSSWSTKPLLNLSCFPPEVAPPRSTPRKKRNRRMKCEGRAMAATATSLQSSSAHAAARKERCKQNSDTVQEVQGEVFCCRHAAGRASRRHIKPVHCAELCKRQGTFQRRDQGQDER